MTDEVPMFGREPELAAALRTRAGVAGIAGPAGIGKSRLAGEIVRRLEQDGFRALQGSGGPLHRDLSYAPVVAALRPLVAEPRLVRGLGELGRLFDGLPVPRSEPLSEPLSDRRLERTRLFEAVCTLLRRVSTPLVVHLDDLHWADSDSLALLHYLVRGLADRPVLFLLAYRAQECGPDATALLTALRHADQLTETTLGSLDSAAVRRLVSALLDDEPPAALLELLPGRAAGVPLFVRALVDGLREEGGLTRTGGRWVLRGGELGPVPDIVADLLRARIEALDEPARTVLDAIAVAGGWVTHGVLAGSVPDETTVLDGVRRLRRAGLVEEEVAGGAVGYRTTYRLLSEVAYGLIPAAARGELHAAAARATHGDQRALAFHVRNAGDAVPAEQAFEVLAEAARAAFAARRGEEAAANARAAIHAADRQNLRPDTELAELLAESYELAARTDRARAAWLAAADLPGATATGRAGCLVNAAMAEWDLGRPDAADAHLDSAAACLATEPPGPAHVALTTSRLRWASRRGEPAVLRALLGDLDGLIAATGSEPGRVTRAGYQVALDLSEGRYDAALAGMDAAVDAAARWGDPLLMEWVHRPVLALMLGCGDLAATRRHAHAAISCAEAAGVPALAAMHRVILGMVDLFNGRWDEAVTASFDALELAAQQGSSRHAAIALALQGLVLARRGRFAEAVRRAEEARHRFGPWSAVDRHVFCFIDQIEVEVALGQGDAARAARLAAVVVDRFPASLPLALGTLGDAALRAGDETTARTAADRLDVLGAPYPRALARWLRGRLARDPAVLADAATALGAAGMVYDEAVAVLDRADLGAADPAELDARVRVLDRLGARPQADRARSLLRALGERPAPNIRPGRRPNLSDREEQVARLVAEGLSNAEVATRLFISPRTVTTHLQNIYGRLGLGSRTALARYVLEHLPADT